MIIGAIYKRLSKIIFDYYDYIHDILYCGVSLNIVFPQNVCVNEEYTDSQSCRYIILKKIFQNVNLSGNDHFLEVGFGTGRVLAYLLHKNISAKITGIEINPLSYNYCLKWLKSSRIKLERDDVFNIQLDSYSVFFLGHPFSFDVFRGFINKIETELTHKILLICVIDLEYGDYLDSKQCWSLISREQLFKYNYLYLLKTANRFSIWSYNPQTSLL